MNNPDLQYICTMLANLCGTPVRIYDEGKQIFYHSIVYLPKDPINIYKDEILSISDNVGYFSSENFHYYGIVNYGNYKIVMGPTMQISDSEQNLRQLAFRLDVPEEDISSFVSAMKCIIPIPIESVVQTLCSINYILNGEKLTLEQIAVSARDIPPEYYSKGASAVEKQSGMQNVHNTYDIEQAMMRMVRKGETAALSEWISNAPAVRGGIIAPEQLRQYKNTFIVSATLASRAAIRGGLDVNDAFALSDAYIQKCELLSSIKQITNLQYSMVLDFTDRVNRIRIGSKPTALVLEVSNYIIHHISEVITTEAIAKELHMSRSYLSRRFKSESGENLSDCILREKVEEAKRLLRYTDKSLSAIGIYLAFSSQSHFSRVFKSYTGSSPSEYRQNNIVHI